MSRERALELRDPLICASTPVAGGKTSFLIEKAASILAKATETPRVLVVVNTAEQARAFGNRLAAAGADLRDTRIDIPHRILVNELAAHGQALRLLTRAELNIVIEDLKYAGIAPREIKSMLVKLRKGLARGVGYADDRAEGEEAAAYRALQDRLTDMGATMRDELAMRVLDLQAKSIDRPYDYVLVDGAQNLSVATLRALKGMAGAQMIVAGNPLQALPGFDPGFGSEAFAAFSISEHARCVRLEPSPTSAPAIASFGQALCGFGFEDSPFWLEPVDVDEFSRTAVMHVKWREPKDEVEGVCRIVAGLLDADPDLLPRDICIAVPDRACAAAFEKELERRRLMFQTLLDDDPVAGDPRSRERIGTLGVYGLLGLAADLDDACAWRFWFALGREDLGCGLWREFRAYRLNNELSCRDAAIALSATDEIGPADLTEVRARIDDAFDSLRLIEGKRGFTLRNQLCRSSRSSQLARIFEFFDGVEEASELFGALQELSFAPSFADRPSQIRIGSYRSASTLSPRHVFAPCMVDGIVGKSDTPTSAESTDRERAWAAQRRALGCASACARESFTASSFQRADAGLAQKEKLPVRRTRRYQGREMAVFPQSPFFEDAGDSMPGSVSGEQYFIDGQERKK